MSGPWDNYAQPQAAQAGPWAKYGQQEQPPQSNALSDAYRQALLSGDTVTAHKIAVQARQQGVKIAPVSDSDINQSVDQRFARSVQNEPKAQQAIEGFGKSFADTGQGLGELVGAVSPQQVAQSRQFASPLMKTTGGQLGYGAGVAGQIIGGAAVGGLAAGAPALAGVAAAAPTVGGTLLSGTLTGAAYGDVAPYATTGEHVGNIAAGTLAGPAIRGAIGSARLIGRGGQALLQRYLAPGAVAAARVGRALAEDGVVPAMVRAGNDPVAGVKPTLAQVLQTPKAVQLERAARNGPVSGPDMVALDNANNAARIATIEKHAGKEQVGSLFDPATGTRQPMDALQGATMTRRANADPFLAANVNYMTPAERWRDAINVLGQAQGRMSGADRDAIREAQRVAQKVRSGQMQEDDAAEEIGHLAASVTSKTAQDAFTLAQQATTQRMVNAQPVLDAIARRLNNSAGQDTAVTGALSSIRKRILDATDSRGNVPVDVLDGIRQNGRSFITENAPGAFSVVSTRQIAGVAPVQNSITELLSHNIPGYTDYLTRYADQSVPVNTMTSIREFLDPNTVKALNSAGDRQATATQLSRFLRNNADSSFGISPTAQRDMEAVHQSLLNRSVADQKIAASGPSTAADLQNKLARGVVHHLGAGVGGAVGFGTAGPAGSIVGALAGHGADLLDNLARNRIATAEGRLLMNPSASADALQNYLLLQGRRQAFDNALLPFGQYGGVGSVAGLLASPSRSGGGQ